MQLKNKNLVPIVLILIILLGMTGYTFLYFNNVIEEATLGQEKIISAIDNLQNGKYEQAHTDFRLAKEKFRDIKTDLDSKQLDYIILPLTKTPIGDKIEDNLILIDLAYDVAVAGEDLTYGFLLTMNATEDMSTYIENREENFMYREQALQNFELANKFLKQGNETLDKIKLYDITEIENLDNSRLETYFLQLNDASKLISQIIGIIDLMPIIIDTLDQSIDGLEHLQNQNYSDSVVALDNAVQSLLVLDSQAKNITQDTFDPDNSRYIGQSITVGIDLIQATRSFSNGLNIVSNSLINVFEIEENKIFLSLNKAIIEFQNTQIISRKATVEIVEIEIPEELIRGNNQNVQEYKNIIIQNLELLNKNAYHMEKLTSSIILTVDGVKDLSEIFPNGNFQLVDEVEQEDFKEMFNRLENTKQKFIEANVIIQELENTDPDERLLEYIHTLQKINLLGEIITQSGLETIEGVDMILEYNFSSDEDIDEQKKIIKNANEKFNDALIELEKTQEIIYDMQDSKMIQITDFNKFLLGIDQIESKIQQLSVLSEVVLEMIDILTIFEQIKSEGILDYQKQAIVFAKISDDLIMINTKLDAMESTGINKLDETKEVLIDISEITYRVTKLMENFSEGVGELDSGFSYISDSEYSNSRKSLKNASIIFYDLEESLKKEKQIIEEIDDVTALSAVFPNEVQKIQGYLDYSISVSGQLGDISSITVTIVENLNVFVIVQEDLSALRFTEASGKLKQIEKEMIQVQKYLLEINLMTENEEIKKTTNLLYDFSEVMIIGTQALIDLTEIRHEFEVLKESLMNSKKTVEDVEFAKENAYNVIYKLNVAKEKINTANVLLQKIKSEDHGFLDRNVDIVVQKVEIQLLEANQKIDSAEYIMLAGVEMVDGMVLLEQGVYILVEFNLKYGTTENIHIVKELFEKSHNHFEDARLLLLNTDFLPRVTNANNMFLESSNILIEICQIIMDEGIYQQYGKILSMLVEAVDIYITGLVELNSVEFF